MSDFQEVTNVCEKFAVGGKNFRPSQVPVTTAIIVYELPDNTSRESVGWYFENKTRSGGGEVIKTEDHDDEGYCVIYFKDPSGRKWS